MKLSTRDYHVRGLVLSFCLLILLTGCNSNRNTISLPSDLGIPDNILNQDLRVTAPAIWNDFKKEEDFITLEITLVTNKEIVTTPDFGAKVYLYDDMANDWQKIENLGNYETPPDKIYMRQGDYNIFALLPKLSKTPDSQNTLLILVSGQVVEDGKATDQVVGTYLILKLKP